MSALLTLLRLIFPAWAFFDRAGAPPALEVRARVRHAPPGTWHPAVQPPRRRWWQLLFNPQGTLALAEQTLVERWHSELDEGRETAVTRALVEQLVAARMPDPGARAADVEFEYRLRVVDTMSAHPHAASGNTAPVVMRTLRT